MFNIGDEVIAKKVYSTIGLDGVVISAVDAAKFIAGSENPSIYGSLIDVIERMMMNGSIFVKIDLIDPLSGKPYNTVNYYKKEELTHKIVTKEYDPSQNGDTDEDV